MNELKKAIIGGLTALSSLCLFIGTAQAYSLEGPKWQYPMDITWADGNVDQQAISATDSWNNTPVAIMFYASNSNSADIQTSYGDFGNTDWTGNTTYYYTHIHSRKFSLKSGD